MWVLCGLVICVVIVSQMELSCFNINYFFFKNRKQETKQFNLSFLSNRWNYLVSISIIFFSKIDISIQSM